MRAVSILTGAVLSASATNQGHVSSRPWMPRVSVALSTEQAAAEGMLPRDFDWRDQGLVTADWNQHIPTYCGSCWIHGTLSALNDRIKIRRGGKFPDVMLSRQSVLNCVPSADGKGPPPGCIGGDAYMIHKYMSEHRMPDESCMPYQAQNMGCIADTICRNCKPGESGCYAVNSFIGYGVSSYGTVAGEVAMMKEIHARGPIVCSFATDDEFMFNYSANALAHEGVFVSSTNKTAADIDHDMEVTG